MAAERGDVFANAYAFTRPQDAAALLGEYPFFQEIAKHKGGTLMIGERRMMTTGSNDYLGLSQDPRVVAASQEATARYGTSCTGSRFLTGTLDIHPEMERRMADFLGKEAAMITSAGYLACLSAVSALSDRHDLLYFDKDNHASLYDGAQLGKGTLRRYPHCNLDALERMLERDKDQSKGGKLIVVDGVFSMMGHIADLPRIVELAKRHGARVLVDDAHSLGVLGPQGRGTAHHFGLEDEVDLIMGTFSKSLASVGGYIAGPTEVINWIRHQARPFIFNAAAPGGQVAAAMKALEIMQAEPQRLEKLWHNTRRFHEGLTAMGLDIMGTKTPVVPVLTGTIDVTAVFWKALWDAGVFSTPSVPPAVPPKQCLIRASINASHTDAELDELIGLFEGAARSSGLI